MRLVPTRDYGRFVGGLHAISPAIFFLRYPSVVSSESCGFLFRLAPSDFRVRIGKVSRAGVASSGGGESVFHLLEFSKKFAMHGTLIVKFLKKNP